MQTVGSEELQGVGESLLNNPVPALVDPAPTPLVTLKYHYVVVLFTDLRVQPTVL